MGFLNLWTTLIGPGDLIFYYIYLCKNDLRKEKQLWSLNIVSFDRNEEIAKRAQSRNSRIPSLLPLIPLVWRLTYFVVNT